jgi:hypothetical protein
MLIHIQTRELEEEFIRPVTNGLVTHPAIDYQTNAVHAQFEGKDVIIFNFKKYGWFNDNRFNTYNLSLGPAGITIEIIL